MKKTRICELLRISYPILQGGMLWVAGYELATAVSNAGCLGIISPLAGMEKHGDRLQNMKIQLAKARTLTDKPFGINIPLDLPQSGNLIKALIEDKIEVVVTAAGSPAHNTELLHRYGKKVLHVVSSVRHAKVAAACGVDGVIAEGIEAAGHDGFDELPLFSLLPQVVDAVSIPVIAAGGIVDARGIMASLALGAEGVQMGTRFIAVDECVAHPRYKKAIIDAQDTDTVITNRRLVPTRSLKTEFSKSLIALEASGASADDIRNYLGYSRARTAQLQGDLENGEAYCGSSVGLIKEVLPVADVINRLIKDYQDISEKIFSKFYQCNAG